MESRLGIAYFEKVGANVKNYSIFREPPELRPYKTSESLGFSDPVSGIWLPVSNRVY